MTTTRPIGTPDIEEIERDISAGLVAFDEPFRRLIMACRDLLSRVTPLENRLDILGRELTAARDDLAATERQLTRARDARRKAERALVEERAATTRVTQELRREQVYSARWREQAEKRSRNDCAADAPQPLQEGGNDES